MNRESRRCFAVGCLVAAGWTGSHPLNGKTLHDAPRLTVRLYNYAKVRRGTLAQATATASDVFRRAGIQLVWVDCPVTTEDIEKLRACDQFDGTPWVPLNLLPQEMAQRLQFRHEVFGVAIGSKAYVFFDRVQELSRHLVNSESSTLGHLMAHELGHVLLGPGNHSSLGVMKSDLSKADLQLALKGWLAFNSEQEARMQAQLRQPAPVTSSAPRGGSASAPAGAGYWGAVPAASRLR